jgi:hypothetical protein
MAGALEFEVAEVTSSIHCVALFFEHNLVDPTPTKGIALGNPSGVIRFMFGDEMSFMHASSLFCAITETVTANIATLTWYLNCSKDVRA